MVKCVQDVDEVALFYCDIVHFFGVTFSDVGVEVDEYDLPRPARVTFQAICTRTTKQVKDMDSVEIYFACEDVEYAFANSSDCGSDGIV